MLFCLVVAPYDTRSVNVIVTFVTWNDEVCRITAPMAMTAAASASASGTASSWRLRTRPLATRDGCCLGVLLASHVSSRQRLKYLQQTLASIAAQASPTPDALVLSWYADEPLATEVAAALRAVRLPMRFRCLRQTTRLSQYCHLREALAAFESEAPRDAASSTWLLFCDDDDLWHPDRARLSRLACARASAAPTPTIDVLAFGVYAYPVDAVAQEVRTATQVDGCMQARQAGIWLGACEVFQYAVRPALLRAFLRAEPEPVLCHRFADVRFASWLRHAHTEALVELGADELMRLDRGVAPGWKRAAVAAAARANKAGGGGPPKPTEPGAQEWLVKHWLYFYRNQRQVSAVEWLGDLDDMSTHLEAAGRTAAEQARARQQSASAGGGADDGGYERASTGRQPRNKADRSAARRVLERLGDWNPRSKAAARQEEEQLAAEIGRLRHHAELTTMMCMGFRNAEELAVGIMAQSEGGAAGGDVGLQAALEAEHRLLVREALDVFGHTAERCAGLPVGTVQECLA